jgi:hypothetical protein
MVFVKYAYKNTIFRQNIWSIQKKAVLLHAFSSKNMKMFEKKELFRLFREKSTSLLLTRA